MHILKTNNISKSFDNKFVIKDINITLGIGEIVSILGVSGSGKTTLFNILSGLLTPDNGSVILDDKDVTGVTGSISYMQQKDLLLPFKTILQNVSIPLILKGESKSKSQLIAHSYFNEFGLDGCENKYPSQISGGMKQRAALLRSYLFSNKVMLLDEPFSALDAFTKDSLHKWFKTIAKNHNTSCLFITHDINEAILLSDRIYILSSSGTISHEFRIENITDTTCQEFNTYKRQILSQIK